MTALQTKESGQTQRWTDTRASAKAVAAAALETIKRRALWRAAHLSRAAAIELGNPRYTGRPCRFPGHGGLRFVSGGGCVECARKHAERKRRLRGTPVKGPRPQARHGLRSNLRQDARRRRAEERGAGRAALR
jgi:hypothetical protein